MAEARDSGAESALSERVIEQVKQALEHIYDLSYLQNHVLACLLETETAMASESNGQRLRRLLLAAIEELSPGPAVAFQSPHARAFHMLQLHYVEGLTVQEAANDLNISIRQAYRNLRQGEENVATVLLARLPSESRPAAEVPPSGSVDEELERLEINPEPIDVVALIERAQQVVAQLAIQHGVRLEWRRPGDTASITADPSMAHQVLVAAMIAAIQRSQPGLLQISVQISVDEASLQLRYTPGADSGGPFRLNAVAVRLVERLRWTAATMDEPSGVQLLTVHMRAHATVLLVIDDNTGLIELVKRYLTHVPCQVIAAMNGREGRRLAIEAKPDAILLDVMMPGVDGWEVLQMLRADPVTARTPVIICSVFDEPELAYSLGASSVLHKPIRQEDLLTAILRLSIT